MGSLRYHSAKPISKTIDIGRDGTAVSVDGLGSIHGLTVFHSKHGLVLAEPYPQFDRTRFHDSQYVREHRTRMIKSLQAGIPGFGFHFDIDVRDVQIEFEGLGSASVFVQAAQGIELTTALTISNDGEVAQSCHLVNHAKTSRRVQYYAGLRMSINRASYGQLTEGGPLDLPKSRNELELVNGGLTFMITNSNLGASLTGHFSKDGQQLNLAAKIRKDAVVDVPVEGEISEALQLRAGECRHLEARFRLQTTGKVLPLSPGPTVQAASRLALWKNEENQARLIIRRNLEYILGNCAIPIPSAGEVVCLIADHVALPLGWNRDNYWQAHFLLDVHQHLSRMGRPETQQTYLHLIKRALKGHLAWVFRYAQRPEKYWHRSYLVTGRPKDGAVFQLDQQCYPLLLLCDFLSRFPEEKAFVIDLATDGVIHEVLDMIESKRDPSKDLFVTEETPGDDEVEYPFHFSSQVLLWHTFSKLSRVARKTMLVNQLCASRCEESAARLKPAIMRHFLARAGPESRPIFVYLTNGEGLSKVYHDANDMPTLFAEEWGFCKSRAETEAWQNTMKFGFSVANHEGYYGEGRFGGLGSIHTPGPWPLGYFQMWRFAQMIGDREAEQRAWEKICGSMQWDGLFPEAVDAETGDCISKAWFCWPGAMIGSGLLQDGVRMRYL